MPESFNNYIDNYRSEQDNALHLSGETSSFFAVYKTEKLMKWFESSINKPITILDFGCGDGLMTNFVKQAFWQARVIGIDPSSASIKVAKTEYPELEFYDESLKNLNFEEQTFDIIFAAGVFHHIPLAEHPHHLEQIARLLRPGGSFVLFELNPWNPLTVITFKRNPIDYDARMMNALYAKKLLRSHGTVKTIFYCFFPKWFSRLRFLEPFLEWLPVGALYASILKK